MPRRLLAMPVLLLPLLLGCTQDATVSGTVTYDGKPVEDGFITFYPADQKGVNRGGEIHDGRYTVDHLAPGKKRVHITASPRPELVENTRTGTRTVRVRPPEHPIPAAAAGNDEVLELAGGPQTLDFDLKPPARK